MQKLLSLPGGHALTVGLSLAMPLGLLTFTPAWAESPPASVAFQIKDASSDEVLSLGVETVRWSGDAEERATTYSSPDGAAIWAEETAEFDKSALRRFVFADRRSGERQEVRIGDDGTFRIESTSAAGTAPDAAMLELPPGTLLGKSIPVLLLREWKRLMAGEAVDFRLLVAERRDSFAFRARRMDESKAGRVRILVEPDSWVIRLFAPNLVFEFESARPGRQPRLVELVAPAPLALAGERYRRVRMVFHGPDATAVKPAF